jgi:hypothetical protein
METLRASIVATLKAAAAMTVGVALFAWVARPLLRDMQLAAAHEKFERGSLTPADIDSLFDGHAQWGLNAPAVSAIPGRNAMLADDPHADP